MAGLEADVVQELRALDLRHRDHPQVIDLPAARAMAMLFFAQKACCYSNGLRNSASAPCVITPRHLEMTPIVVDRGGPGVGRAVS
jgi:hypothetical protein